MNNDDERVYYYLVTIHARHYRRDHSAGAIDRLIKSIHHADRYRSRVI